MKIETLVYGAAAVLCTGWLLCPESTQAARHDYNLNLSGNAETCASASKEQIEADTPKAGRPK